MEQVIVNVSVQNNGIVLDLKESDGWFYTGGNEVKIDISSG